MDNQLSISLFEKLDRENVDYAVLRNYKTLPESLGGSDIDIWVSDKDAKLFFKILETAAKEQDAHLVSYLYDAPWTKVCYMNKNNGIQIDLYSGCIPYQNTHMIEGKVIHEHTIRYKNLRVLDDRLANLIAFVKEIIHNGKCGDKYIRPLYDNAELYSPDYVQSVLTWFSPRFSVMLSENIRKRQLDQKFEELKVLGRTSLKSRHVLWHKIKKVTRLLNKPGYVIVMAGVNDYGNAAVVQALKPILDDAFHNGVFIKSIPPTAKSCRNNKPVIQWFSCAKAYISGYIKMYRIIATGSKICIFECTFNEDQLRQKPLSRWIVKLGNCILPKPDLVLLATPHMDMTNETGDDSVSKRRVSKRKNTVLIDATLSQEDYISLVKESILEVMSKRFKHINFE